MRTQFFFEKVPSNSLFYSIFEDVNRLIFKLTLDTFSAEMFIDILHVYVLELLKYNTQRKGKQLTFTELQKGLGLDITQDIR